MPTYSGKDVLLTTAAIAIIYSVFIHQKNAIKPKIHHQDKQKKVKENSTQDIHYSPPHFAAADLHYILYPINYEMHAIHRQKLIQQLLSVMSTTKGAAVLLHGGSEISRYDTDTVYNFRQESFFQYLFGVAEPDCAAMIDLGTKHTILFIPRRSSEIALWCGEQKPSEYYQSHYGVHGVYYTDEIGMILEDKYKITKLLVLQGSNADSGLETVTTSNIPKMKKKIEVDYKLLHPALVECRVIKSEEELSLMRFTNTLSSQAHVHVMQNIRAGHKEFHAESEFVHYCFSKGGARFHAYTCICGSGHNASVLHYGHDGTLNEKSLKDGELLLNDMGAELHGYASDITCTFPINGKFTHDQKIIYNSVLHAHDAVMNAIKPGVSYVDLHLLSHRVLTQHLLEYGLFQNGTVDELMKEEISAYFYPHGLGHMLGLDVHDVGGYDAGEKKNTEKKILSKLRCGRILKKNMVVTVEPGCYFIEAQINELLESPKRAKFINMEMLDRFRGTGGVRIESDVIVTANGVENMTKVPRTVTDVEDVMAGKPWDV